MPHLSFKTPKSHLDSALFSELFLLSFFLKLHGLQRCSELLIHPHGPAASSPFP
jgi:hypothetical protein